MFLRELEEYFDLICSMLENSIISFQESWKHEYESLKLQLDQSLTREAKLKEHNALLISKLRDLDKSPGVKHSLLHNIRIINSHVKELTKEISMFQK